jgi:hypothetical protein
MPSPEVARKFLKAFHEEDKDWGGPAAALEDEMAYIPEENRALEGLAESTGI